MERETVVNFVTKTLDYLYPPSRWGFFRTNPNQVRAEQLFDTLNSAAKLLNAILSIAQQLKTFYPQSYAEQLTEQQRLEYEQKDQQDGTNITVTVDGESFTVIEKTDAEAAEVQGVKPKI